MKNIILVIIQIVFLFHYSIAQENANKFLVKQSVHASYGIFAPVRDARADDWPSGFGTSVRYRFLSDQIISVQLGALYNPYKYIAPQPYYKGDIGEFNNLHGSEYDPYLMRNGHPDGVWYPSYKSVMTGVDLTANLSVRNAIFKLFDKTTSWDLSIDFGIGYMQKEISLDLLNTGNQPYTKLLEITKGLDFDTSNGRKSIRSAISDHYDGKYESASSIGKLNYLMSTYGLTLSKKIGNDFEVGLNYKTIRYNNKSLVENFDDQSFSYLATTDEKNVLLSILLGYYL